jgi:chorismate synthase
MIGGVLRFLTAGESHGRGLVVIVEGLPAGVPVSADAIAGELARRRHGYGRGGRQRFEADAFEIQAGVRHGRTIGAPVAITIPNVEFEQKYAELMAADGEGDPSKALTRPRPGHADLVGALKYGFDDVRNVLERASARETAARVAAGALCRSFLAELGISILSHVVQIGKVKARRGAPPAPDDMARIDASPTPTRRARWSRRSTGSARLRTARAASSRCSHMACRPASVPTYIGIASWTPAWRRR